MRVTIDRDRCEGHAQCVAVAPDVYDLDDDAVAIVRTGPEIPEPLQQLASYGADMCPVMAILVDDQT
jgi:ferredoxin